MELTLAHQSDHVITVQCDNQHSHTFDLKALIPDSHGPGHPPQPLDDPVSYGQAIFAALFPPDTCARQTLEREPDRLMLDAIDAAIAAAPPPYRLIFTLLCETGMRIGEVLALQLGDVDLSPGREGVRVREAKNHSERIALLGATATPRSLRGLRALVKELRGQPGHVPLFRSNRGTSVSYAAAQYQWAQRCEAQGLIEQVGDRQQLRSTLHQLRHTCGSELVRQGQPMEIVQRVLGHRDIRSTQGYAELDDLQVRAALER